MALIFNPIPKFEDHERFLTKIKINPNGCWEWLGYINNGGYGTFAITGKMYETKKYFAHRVSFSLFKKQIEVGLDIDHICINKKCVNPDHLREVTRAVNLKENTTGKSAPLLRANMKFCKRGHEYVKGSFYKRKDGGRECKKCNSITSKAWRKTETGKASRKQERARSIARKMINIES